MLEMITGHIYRKIIQSSSCWKKSLQEDHFVNLEGDCKADEAEVLLIKNNYKMFEDLE